MGDLSEHFSRREFKCPDCGNDAISLLLVKRLEQARRLYGKPMHITSGVRCAAHNTAVGGKKNSAHLKGLAADIKCDTSYDRYALLMALLTVAFPRIEIGPHHLHVDVDGSKAQDVCMLA